MADTTRPFKKIVIVGAGPAGLLLALLLSKHGIPVTILEMSHQLDQQPRAAHYGLQAIPDLKRAGILARLRAQGYSLNTLHWRRLEDHAAIAGFDAAVLADVDGEDWRTVSYPLQDLDQLMLDEFVDKYRGEVRWRHRVLGVGQDADKAWVDVETPEGKSKVEADYVVGCDGASSMVRRALFGDEFPGFTWDAQIIATNVSGLVCHSFRCRVFTDKLCGRLTMTLRANSGFLMPTSSSTLSTSSYVPLQAPDRAH